MSSYGAISGHAVQFQKNAGGAAASDYFIRLFEAGTTTPLLMGTDNTGSTLFVNRGSNRG